ncbi:MAG: hypothetical protein HXY24_11025 [Rubrivivax sp.]|nr:hypothetical protein [Rubrivivax sp.]
MRPKPASSRHVAEGDAPLWFGWSLVGALWMLARPYVGLRHDGILYLGQALAQLQPDVMERDVFFAFGSQGSYTLMTGLLASWYERWGIAVVQVVVPTLAHVALLAVSLQVLRPLPSASERWLGLAALAVFSHVYGGLGIFAFAERFLTGRTLAEPLALAAVAFVATGRLRLGLVAVAAAGLFHPLVALPTAVVIWVTLVQRDRRWAWVALVAVAALAALAAFDVRPFDGLLQRFDEPWWSAVVEFNGQVLLSRWHMVDWQIVVFDIGVLAAASKLYPAPLSTLARAVALSTGLLLAVSFVGADLARNVLVTQLQLWRVLWLTHLLGIALVPAIVLWCWRQGKHGRLLAIAVAAAAVATNGKWEAGWVFLIWIVAVLVMYRKNLDLSAGVRRITLLASGLALIGLSTAVAANNAMLLSEGDGPIDAKTASLLLATMPIVALPAAGAALWAWRRGRAAAIAALLVTAATAAFGAVSWDRRADWTRFIEGSLHTEHPFAPSIPRHAQVYWHKEVAATWAMLRRASFYSTAQGAGLLFNRGTTVEFTRRHEAFKPLHFQERVCGMMAALNAESKRDLDCAPTDELIARLCSMDNGPDFMIFERAAAAGAASSWTFSAGTSSERTFYLHDCSHFR